MPHSITTYLVDSFTDQPFKGNPAGVCVLKQTLSDEQMQLIAQELGLSETAFITQHKTPNSFAIRYFSPKMEIPLCGHATLASSKVVFELFPDLEHIHFHTMEGLDLLIKKKGKQIVMEFPIYDTVPQDAPDALLDALGIKEIINSAFNKETNILLLEIEHSDVLQQLSPDFAKLLLSHDSINGVLVTAASQREGYDFESRYFWPWSGTNEDPVTGGTHTFLAKYWSTRLHKTKMKSFQCSARTGFMEVELINAHTVTITSDAQVVLRGELEV